AGEAAAAAVVNHPSVCALGARHVVMSARMINFAPFRRGRYPLCNFAPLFEVGVRAAPVPAGRDR
ncbi:MAG TPA: hypothetical protein VJN70_19895, partial [Gemmatimonadaceae bacterium]|nr:hypothetical protein [Gemmatimonadaceae bacterium]